MEYIGSSPFKYDNFDNNLPPNIILNRINNDTNHQYPNIISKSIRISTNPIKTINYYDNDNECRNIRYIKKSKNIIYPNNTVNLPVKNNYSGNNNIYCKKRLNDGFIPSSVTSGVNSSISNTQRNNILNNIEYINNNSDNNIENNNVNNIYNIKTTNNKSTNILIKNIYSNDDYFNTNIKEGLLHLKDFEIYKSNKISQLDIENENIKQRESINREINKPLSLFLIKSEKKPHLAKSCENIIRNKKYKSSENSIKKEIFWRQKSVEINIHRKNNILGKISRLMNYFNKRRKYCDKIIFRGTRNEKGGVVDFSTASPKKYYMKNKYFINKKTENKNLYKYPRLKIISSAKIIQNWWRKKKILYFIFMNAIKKIQKNIRNFFIRNKDKESIKKKEREKEMNKNKKIGVILLKKVLELKIANLFCFVLIKTKNVIDYEQDDNIVFLKYVSFIESIISYVKNIKMKMSFSFLIKLRENKNYKTNYIKTINESNFYFEGKKNSKRNNSNQNNDITSDYYEQNCNSNYVKNKQYNEEELQIIFNIFFKILFRAIINKIKKEANRRTLIKAFRDINRKKYPTLFYSFFKLQKYSNIKYKVMNAYAIMIQRYYREFKDKKIQAGNFYY